MFTGLIEAIGFVSKVERRGESVRIAFSSPWGLTEIKVGGSISVNGACLTVVGIDGKTFSVDVSKETIARTTLGGLKPTDPVNLERPLTPADRLGGHLVLGHVDGTATIAERREEGGFLTITFRTSEDLSRSMVEKGSVAIDGISLAVNEWRGVEFSVSIIPLTSQRTTIGRKRVGDKVNVETDIIGKYVQRFLSDQTGEERPPKSRLDMEFLIKHGFK
ncbi:MAG: riboflavin synthase [Syntrophobacterales bacterium]|nr:MAG: riboflavin synthase [Syntrophobacterales bacterium]